MKKRYLFHTIPEYILCLLAAACLQTNMMQSFDVPEKMYTAFPLFFIVSGIVLAALFLIAYSRKTITIGVPVFIAALIVIGLVCLRSGVSFLETKSPEANAGVAYLIIIGCILLVFLLSRNVIGSIVLAVLGTFMQAWVCLLLYDFYNWALIIYIWAAIVLFIVSRYRKKVLTVSTVKTAFKQIYKMAMICALVVVLIASVLWYGVIAPMEPPTKDLNLITKMVSLDVFEQVGVARRESLLNDLFTNQLDEEKETDTNEMEEEEEPEEEDSGLDEEEEVDDTEGDNLEGMAEQDQSTLTMQAQGKTSYLLIILTIVVILLIIAGIWRFLKRHSIWLKKQQKLEKEKQIEAIYNMLCHKLDVLGMKQKPGMTPLTYAQHIQGHMSIFDEGGPKWQQLSQTYSDICYGGYPVSEADYQMFITYYSSFVKRCKKVCKRKYIWMQFRL